jgi:nitrate reductase assembly molybdenum cofactor insertion protein NarJ
MTDYAHYFELAGLFDFPDESYLERARSLLRTLQDSHPDAAAELAQFVEAAPRRLDQLQELHTGTFDVQSITTLGVGYVLFGDDYKRGDLLANLNREHLVAENDCRGELADHLPNVLRLIPKMRDAELRAELVADLLIPALMLMIHEFEPLRVTQKNQNYQKHYKTLIEAPAGCDKAIYAHSLRTVLNVMQKDFSVAETVGKLQDLAQRQGARDFLGMLVKELEIETTANPQNSGCDH